MNGTIKYKIFTGGGYDNYGNPVRNQSEWSDGTECRYKANLKANNGIYNGGTFQQAKFEITVFDMETPDTINEVQLFDYKGSIVEEKQILSIEVLESIQRIKIVI